MTHVPSLPEFVAAVREAFGFLGAFGFREVSHPTGRHVNAFEVWFGADDRFVVVSGEGHGTLASTHLEHAGRELAETYLSPTSELPTQTKEQLSQLEQIRNAATRLECYGCDFLAGDLSRFLEMSKPLPPYKSSPAGSRNAG